MNPKHKEEIERLNEQNDDAEIKRQIAALNNVNKHLLKCLDDEKKARIDEVKRLNDEIKHQDERKAIANDLVQELNNL